jgi:aspartate/methionine/tyrosine aminotransferase
LVDETFREFTPTPSITRRSGRGVWVCRSFTKAYGADGLRVGYVVAPEEEAERFEAFHSLVLDSLPLHSVAAVRAIVRDRDRILAETRQRFRTNLAALRKAVPGTPELAAPVWFDRGSGEGDGDRFSRRALDAGVLICSGSFFGDPTGVRVCLTQRSFPRDLDAYLPLRERWF